MREIRRRPAASAGRVLCLLAAGLLASALPTSQASAQTAGDAEPADGGFADLIEVRRVNLEVYVTDKKGKRVEDLRQEDFQILEDGEPAEITNFARIKEGRAPIAADLAEPRPNAPILAPIPEPPTAAGEPEVAEDQRLHLVVYVDNLHTKPFNRDRVLAQVRQFLRTVPRGTRIMLVTFDRAVHVREEFTADRQMVIDRTFALEDLASFAVQKETERDQLLQRLRGNTQDLDMAVSDIDFYAKSAYNDIELSVRGVGELIERIAGLPGRKAVVYVSDGLDRRPGDDLISMVYNQFSQNSARSALPLMGQRHSTSELLRDLVLLANSHRVTLYTIDAGGLRTSSATSADRGNSSTIEADLTFQLNRQESLVFLAAETGGLAAIGTNNFGGAFEQIAVDLGSYYSIGFRPRGASVGGDGRYRKLKVKVARPGLEVRYRDGYRDKTQDTRTRETTLASLLHGTGGNPLGLELRVLPLQREGDGYLLPIEVRIPIGRMTLVPVGAIWRGRLRVALAVADERGDLSPIEQQTVPIEVPAADLETAKTQVYVYTAALRIGAGRQRIAASVRDELAGVDSSVVRALEIGRR
jgi:VWFA-related protein